jgi:putative ABC transport system permease protein
MNKKIPTAEEYFEENLSGEPLTQESVIEGLIEFTKLHVQEALKAVNSILNAVNVVVIGIAAISLIVGGIGIANTMYTSVLERSKEIGTMKAIGARNSDILLIFITIRKFAYNIMKILNGKVISF